MSKPFNIVTTCPAELAPMAEDLARFFADMVLKMAKNAHRGRWPNAELKNTFDHLVSEVKELRDAILNESDEAVRLESADVANQALIVGCVAIERRQNDAAPRAVELDETFKWPIFKPE